MLLFPVNTDVAGAALSSKGDYPNAAGQARLPNFINQGIAWVEIVAGRK